MPNLAIVPDFDDSIFGPKEIINHAQQLLEVTQASPKEIFSNLLTQIQAIDFVDLAGVRDETKLKNVHYRIIAIQNIIAIAQKNNWGLCRNQAFTYVFNGCYWSLIDEDDMKSFLGKAAEKMGVPWDKSRDYVFLNGLFEQFLRAAHFETPTKKDSVLIPLLNGTFEISANDKSMRGFDKGDFLTYQLPFVYDPKATSPIFHRYLREVLPDHNSQLVLSEYLGYLFTTTLKLEKALILLGPGANGKSVLFEIVSRLLGLNNVCHYSLSNLTDVSGYHRAMLANKLVNYASEINGNLEASLFKQIVSGEPIVARLPYGNPMTITNYAKLIFNSNALPHDVEHTYAFFRRFLIIPFEVTIKPEDQDVELSKKIIRNELPGVFNWILSGLDRLLQNKAFTHCEAAKNQLEAYRKQSDTVALFLEDEKYEISLMNSIPLKEMYPKYKTYCIDNGYRPGSSRTLSERLRNLSFVLERKRDGFVVYAERE